MPKIDGCSTSLNQWESGRSPPSEPETNWYVSRLWFFAWIETDQGVHILLTWFESCRSKKIQATLMCLEVNDLCSAYALCYLWSFILSWLLSFP